MIHIEKKKPQKKVILLLSLLCALVLLIAAYFIISAVTGGNTDNPGDGKKEEPDIRDGESTYLNYRVAYEALDEAKFRMISIENDKGSFALVRNDKGYFVLIYTDEYGEQQVYLPPVTEADSTFDYEDLYAIEQNDGYNRIPKLTYLCVALGRLYFEERIELPESGPERTALLEEYGFTEDNKKNIVFTYNNEDETTGSHRVTLGDALVTDGGYYYMVDNRNYIYSTNTGYIKYVLAGFTEYVRSTLVSKGLKEDAAFEPYLTTAFREWVREVYDTEGTEVLPGSEVIFTADIYGPGDKSEDGYDSSGYRQRTLDLAEADGIYARLIKVLERAKVGKYYDPDDPDADRSGGLIATVLLDDRVIKLNDGALATYTYNIRAIESILTEDGEVFTAGTVVGDENLIKITYDYGGDKKNTVPMHAVLDLTAGALPASVVSALRAQKIGEFDTPLTFDITYTTENSVKHTYRQVLTDIVSIYKKEDKNYVETNAVTKESTVSYRYYEVIDGVAGEVKTVTIDFSADDTEEGAAVLALILGKTKGNGYNIDIYSTVTYTEVFSDFYTYRISSVDRFVTSDMIVSFRFYNASKRDPFYSESLYENTLSRTNKFSIYALNSAACESVVKILGGIDDASGDNNYSTSESLGLSGLETVAVGITPKVMEKYGLYAYKIYFELPRGILTSENDDPNKIDDYDWYETLGFTLYISKEDYDGYRYIGSDLYDVVCKVDGKNFVFLDHGFADFWARRTLMMVDVSYILSIDVDMRMDDLSGKYHFGVDHLPLYIGTDGKAYTTPPSSMSYTDYDYITVDVSGGGAGTAYDRFLAENPTYDSVSLTELYTKLRTDGKNTMMDGNDAYGTSMFKSLMKMIFFTNYGGTLTEEEQATGLAEGNLLMKMSVKVNSSGYLYSYEFYRISDRRVMVRLYQESTSGTPVSTPVSDFYLSTYAFKKIVSGYLALLNAEDVQADGGYTD